MGIIIIIIQIRFKYIIVYSGDYVSRQSRKRTSRSWKFRGLSEKSHGLSEMFHGLAWYPGATFGATIGVTFGAITLRKFGFDFQAVKCQVWEVWVYHILIG